MPSISRIAIYRVPLVSRDGGQKISGGRVIAKTTSIIVAITSDTGLTGWGEAAPWGLQYLPTFPGAIEAGMAHLAPVLIGCDPCAPGAAHDRLTGALLTQPYVVSALDIACWDLAGQILGVPVYGLLGGRRGPDPFISAHIGSAKDDFVQRMQRYRADGVTQFSAKMSGEVAGDTAFIRAIHAEMQSGESLKVDANRGWRLDEALRVAHMLPPDIDIAFEQPCDTYEACRDFRRACGRPMILDEGAADLPTIMRAWSDGVMDGLNLKIARHGGLSGARVIRDALAALNVPMHIQDMGGSDFVRAAIAHLSISTPSGVMLQAWDPGNLVATKTASRGARVDRSRMSASDAPGFGLQPDWDVLGDPVAICDEAGFRTL